MFFPSPLLLGTDVNECEVYGTCPQDCKNTKGSYECFCAEGFLSVGEPHGTECAAQGKLDFDQRGKFFTNVFFFFLLKLNLLIAFHFCIGNPPVLLLPDNIRIRRFNLSTEEYSDYVDNAEHIQALDYLWDPEGQGLSMLL